MSRARFALTGLVLLLLGVAAACGSDGDAPPGAQPQPASPQPADVTDSAPDGGDEPNSVASTAATETASAQSETEVADAADVATATATAVTPGVELLNCDTRVGDDVPQFYSRYFQCTTIEIDGDAVVITSDGLPPHRSYYYGEGSDLFDPFDFSRGAEYRPNPNIIGGPGFVLRIPLQPVAADIVIDANTVNASTGDATDYPLGVAGVALNSVALFNPLAAPGDDIEDEKFTFDGYNGHPQQRGVYHYHAVSPGPLAVLQSIGATTSSAPGAAEIELYGIMCDGTVVMGLTELDGGAVSADLDLQAGHAHDLVDRDGATMLVNRYHVHIDAGIGANPRGLNPEALYYRTCDVS